MSKKHKDTRSDAPVLFNCNYLSNNQAEQNWIEDLLTAGKMIACPSEIGMVVLMRADRNLMESVSLLSESVNVGSWAVCIPDSSRCLDYWEESPRRDELERVLKVYWPGPLFAVGLASARWRPVFEPLFKRKLPLWQPFNSVCHTVVKSCSFPLLAGQFRWRDGLYRPSPKKVAEEFGAHLELVLEGRESPGTLDFTTLDVSGRLLRMVHRGSISAQDLQRVAGCQILLSGEAMDSVVGSRFGGVRLVVFEGETERVVRRMRALAEGEDDPKSVHYFVHSPGALAAFEGSPNVHPLCGSRTPEEIGDPFSWQKVNTALWQEICRLERRQEVSAVLVEGVPRNENTEEFMERLVRVAHQVVNLLPNP